MILSNVGNGALFALSVGGSEDIMFLMDLGGTDREAAAEVLHEIAREVASGCILVIEPVLNSSRDDRYSQITTTLSVTFMSTGQHDDDLLVSLE